MELAFSDKCFRDLCVNEYRAQEIYGPALSEKLKHRLADLSAVSTVSELLLLPGSPRILNSNNRGLIAINIIHGNQLLLECGHLKPPLLSSGDIDWSRVRRVKILGIEGTVL